MPGNDTIESGRRLEETTDLLARWGDGCDRSAEALFLRLYPDLRDLAGRHAWRVQLADSASSLAQDLCVSLLRQRRTRWRNRGHFFAVAARLIRRLAVDRYRRGERLKRGGSAEHLSLDEVELEDEQAADDVDLVALDRSLDRLAELSPSAARVVELRYFAGLNLEEVAAVLEIGRSTAFRRWSFAKTWLYASMSGMPLPEVEAPASILD